MPTTPNCTKYTSDGEYIFSVQELNLSAKNFLEKQFGAIWIKGEISNLSKPASGHCYFTLKDASGQVRCAFFKQSQLKSKSLSSFFKIEEGQSVLIKAKVTIYPERGDYQLLVEEVLDFGLGLLQQKFEQLKEKLSKAGLFDQAHKKSLPKFIQNLGIITSQTGAAIQDVLSVLSRRFPLMNIIVYHSAVQGEEAPAQLIAALKQAQNENRVETILITRGGGSLEDLWAFNNELFIQEIYKCPIPTISAVGHEIDFTLCDFVADLRAPTPSAAAEILSQDQQEIATALIQISRYLNQAMARSLYRQDAGLTFLMKRLKHPKELLSQKQLKLSYLISLINKNIHSIKLKKAKEFMETDNKFFMLSPGEKIARFKEFFARKETQIQTIIRQVIFNKKQSFSLLCTQLETLSPLKTLSRGYSIATTTTPTKKIITNTENLLPGDLIHLELFQGSLDCRIEQLRYTPAGKNLTGTPRES